MIIYIYIYIFVHIYIYIYITQPAAHAIAPHAQHLRVGRQRASGSPPSKLQPLPLGGTTCLTLLV